MKTFIMTFLLIALYVQTSAASPDCDLMFNENKESIGKLNELNEAYKNASFKAVDTLIETIGFPSIKAEFDTRMRLMKELCWAQERDYIRQEFVELQSEFDRRYLSNEMNQLRNEIEAIASCETASCSQVDILPNSQTIFRVEPKSYDEVLQAIQ